MVASATSASAVPPSPRDPVVLRTAISVIPSPHVTLKVVALAPACPLKLSCSRRSRSLIHVKRRGHFAASIFGRKQSCKFQWLGRDGKVLGGQRGSKGPPHFALHGPTAVEK